LFKEVASRAEAAQQAARANEAAAGVERTSSRLHWIALEIAPEVAALPGLTVRVGPVERDADAWRTPIPVDSGTASIEVRARGKRPFTRTVEIPRDAGTTRVRVARLADTARPAPARRAPEAAGAFFSDARIAGLAVAAGGLAAMGIGVGLGLAGKSAWEDAKEISGCVEGEPLRCRDASAVNDARSLGDVGTGVFIAGLALLAGGALLLVLGGDDEPTEGASARAPHLRLGLAGVALGGSW
jgi:hypothetical protein